ncbi:MAG: helix-turn-helix transcriptional regulator, partial [Clostridia bacterium]|nr:helix-turn-helix transcriptional regulator [Clostridia bacterium]
MKMNDTIREYRRGLGMTQEQLAQQLGVSGPAVSKWEQGASYPDVTLLPALARALHTDLNTLMGFRRMPEKAEITQMLARVNDVVREQGVDAGMALAKDILREYPDCGAL